MAKDGVSEIILDLSSFRLADNSLDRVLDMVLTALGFLYDEMTIIGRNRSARGTSPSVQTEQGVLRRPDQIYCHLRHQAKLSEYSFLCLYSTLLKLHLSRPCIFQNKKGVLLMEIHCDHTDHIASEQKKTNP